jgi:hypothetical protein
MEKRAREMHRVLTVNDKEQWKKFVAENYAQSLIDKPMMTNVQTEENGEVITSTQEEPTGSPNLEKKATMFARLHDDFAESTVSSLKVSGETATMTLTSPSGMAGKISLKFGKAKPYLIEGLGIEVGN